MTILDGLQYDLTTEHLSLIQYIATSSPWVRRSEAAAFERLKSLRGVEIEHAQRISDMIEALGGVPSPRVFEFWRRDLNYLSFDFLAGIAVEHHEEKIGRYAGRAEAAAEWPDVAALYRSMIEDERRKLAELREIAAELAIAPATEAEPSGS